MDLSFSEPIYLGLLVVIPLFLFAHFYSLRFVRRRAVRLANFDALSRVAGKTKMTLNLSGLFLRIIALLSLILSASGAIIWYEGRTTDSSFVLLIDASGSMLAGDLAPNRLEAAKKAATLFVESLDAQTRIGVVSFAGIDQIESPMSLDKKQTISSISAIQISQIHGTAIADAIRSAENLLQNEKGSKEIILLTDGRENVASQDQLIKVAKSSSDRHTTIHTILIGSEQGGLVPGVEEISYPNQDILRQISLQSGGAHFPAQDEAKLQESYVKIAQSIDASVPIPLRIPLLIFSVLVLFVEWTILNMFARYIP